MEEKLVHWQRKKNTQWKYKEQKEQWLHSLQIAVFEICCQKCQTVAEPAVHKGKKELSLIALEEWEPVTC